MRRRLRFIESEVYFPIIIGFHLLLWAVDLFLYSGPLILNEGENPVQRILGEVMASWVVTVFGFNLLMATRAHWVEGIFGGLDKMYLIHRRGGMIAMALLFLHFVIVSKDPEFTIGKPLGFIAMALIFLGIILSAAPFFKQRIPYRKWLTMHRLMGPFYVIGVCHALLVPTLTSKLPLVRAYVFGMAVMGIAAWLYRVLLHRWFHPRSSYNVADIKPFDNAVLAVEMSPVETPLQFVPGQFAFFTFPGINRRESHPFTLASAPEQDRLRIAVKNLGDFTESFQTQIQVGEPVKIEGPYGVFTQNRSSANRQIWVAGGIGITPFLSMAHALKDPGLEVTLYWTVYRREEANFDDELRDLAERTPGLTYHLWLSEENGLLTAEAMPETKEADGLDVFICGPVALRNSLTDQFRAIDIPQRNIHSEEFAFR